MVCTMKTIKNQILRVALLLTVALTGCVGLPEGMTPVSGFDGQRYLGVWYEVARMDNRFERGLYNVTATYTENPDGSIKVTNRGYKLKTEEWKQSVGKAKFKGDTGTGHLKVSFFGPFYASYVVYELDESYQYAFVTGSNKKVLWLLSREPVVDAAVLDRFKTQAEADGYDLSKVLFDIQREDLPR